MSSNFSVNCSNNSNNNSNGRIKLKLNHLNLYGRENEVALLEEAYSRLKGKNNTAQVVFVRGISGSGKTAIVNRLYQTIREEKAKDDSATVTSTGSTTTKKNATAYYVSGKFDQQANPKPFSALVDALSALCDILMKSSEEEERQEFKRRLQASVRDEWATVAQAIPKLANLLDVNLPALAEGDVHYNNALLRLKVLFRALLQSFATRKHPIVMFLDDLQFSDEASLDLLGSLLADKELKNILFILAYREDEVTESLQKLLLSTEVNHIDSFSSIRLGGLDLDYTNDLVSDVTNLPTHETRLLAEVIFLKTRGNAFFILQFLKAAQNNGLLYFCTQTFKWTWDLHKLETEMNISDNVVGLVLDGLHGLQPEVQQILFLASCIGAQFDVTLLATLYENKDKILRAREVFGGFTTNFEVTDKDTEKKVLDMLHVAKEQELIVAGDKQQYMFSHDRVQQASTLLLPEGPEKKAMELRVGLQILLLFYSVASQRWMLFVAVNNLNRSSELLTPEEKFELARLNLETGKRARLESAFLLAAEYFSHGLELLDKRNKWTDHYKLTLDLYILSAEMEYTGGNLDKAKAMSSRLVRSNHILEADKIPLFYTLMRSNGDQLNIKVALDTGIHALHCLGSRLSRHPTLIQVLWNLVKTDRLLKGATDEDLLSRPKMKDTRKMQAMDFLRQMVMYCWVTSNNELLATIFMKQTRLMLRYGHGENSPAAFSSYAMLLASLGREREAFRYGQLAVRMLEADKKGTLEKQAFTTVLVHVFCSHWKRPLANSLDPLLEAHHVGMMEAGDVEWACIAAAAYCNAYINLGLPLEPFTKDAQKFVQCMRDCDQGISLVYAIVTLQFALNLMGQSADPLVLTGEAMNESVLLQELTLTDQKTGIFYTTLYLLQLAYIMRAFDTAYKHARALWALRCNSYKGSFTWNEAIFFSALAEFAYAREYGVSKAPQKAMRYLNDIRYIESQGGVNQHPMRLLLEAEAATFSGSSLALEDIRRKFDQAISAAQRSGFTNYAAIASERAADFMLAGSKNDKYWGRLYVEGSRDCYKRWGASAKVFELEEKYGSLLELEFKACNNSNCDASDRHHRGIERVKDIKRRQIRDVQRESVARGDSLRSLASSGAMSLSAASLSSGAMSLKDNSLCSLRTSSSKGSLN